MKNLPGKAPAILATLASLSAHHGAGEFAIAGHWASDLGAVGLARREDLGVLVDLSCRNDADG